jgi:hypothetical protein
MVATHLADPEHTRIVGGLMISYFGEKGREGEFARAFDEEFDREHPVN